MPSRYIGAVMELVQARRGDFEKMEYLDEQRVLLTYQMPLAELIVDFYDQLKSRTQGYACLDYHFAELPAVRSGQARHPGQRAAGRCAVA